MEFEEYFSMINNKQKEIDRLMFEKKLIEEDMIRKVNKNGYISITRKQAEYTAEEFASKINSKHIAISNVKKQSNIGGDYCPEMFTRFSFKWNEMEFEVHIPTTIQSIEEESFREEDIGKIKLLAKVNSCCWSHVYEGYFIDEVAKKLYQWKTSKSTVEDMVEEYSQYVRDKWKVEEN